MGIVVRVFSIYYAYIEIRDQMRTTERWARELFQTAAAARAWVQDQLLGQVHMHRRFDPNSFNEWRLAATADIKPQRRLALPNRNRSQIRRIYP